jgi:hypothetical protein
MSFDDLDLGLQRALEASIETEQELEIWDLQRAIELSVKEKHQAFREHSQRMELMSSMTELVPHDTAGTVWVEFLSPLQQAIRDTSAAESFEEDPSLRDFLKRIENLR